jgi:hypothetical protein
VNAELAHWLDEATRGLPCRAAAQVRAELSNHYADALEDYEARGKSPNEAHQAALRDLGNAITVRAGLFETYLAPRRYRLAMAAALVFPLVVILNGMGLLAGANGDVLYYLGLLLPTPYILRAFQTLLALRFRVHTQRVMFAAALGLCAMSLPRVASALYVGFTDSIAGGYLSHVTIKGLAGLDAAAILGTLVTGAAFIALCDALFRAYKPSNMLRLFGVLGILTGYAILGNGLAEAFHHADLAYLTNLASLTGVILTKMLWALLFFEALRGDARQPMQTA